ncbi:hypothetical protein [Halopiger djelfimassiliensis]|uniref:hypothetical protein n=1 Tax=Halopiger djelfimassiliensis TaxID=1293047 RepID=UPI000677AFA3|nr:hypothetical protein [Halopiger djelfimassiliensis]
MRVSRSRRALLTSVASFAGLTAGCFESRLTGSDETPAPSGPVDPSTYDCTDVSRPVPGDPSDDDAPDPLEYPSRPDSLSADASQYVTEFERAYRRNELLERYGNQARSFEFSLTARQATDVETDRDRDAVLVAVVYDVTTGTAHAERDEWDVRTTYYADNHVLLRAVYDGIADGPAFKPDPRREGTPVDCFE